MKNYLLIFAVISIFMSCEPKDENIYQQNLEQTSDIDNEEIRVEQNLEQTSDIDNEEIRVEQEAEQNNISLDADIKQYIPENYKILYDYDNQLHLVKGDFNGDDIEDFAVTITSCLDEDCDYLDNEIDVRLLIFEGYDSKFIEKTRSKNISDLIGLDYHSLSLEKDVIVIRGGFRYTKILKIRYENKYDDYMLIGSEQFTSGNDELLAGTAGNISTNYLTGIRLIKYYKYDEEKGSIELPEKKSKVSKRLKALGEVSNSNYQDL